MRGTRVKLMWHGADTWQSYVSPRGPTWMPMWRDESQPNSCVGARYSGPTEGIRGGGALGPLWATQWALALQLYIPDISPSLFSRGTKFLS